MVTEPSSSNTKCHNIKGELGESITNTRNSNRTTKL